MRHFLGAMLVVLSVTLVATARDLVIGQIQYLGTNAQGVSAFKVTLNTNGITESAITFDNVNLTAQGRVQSTGSITTPVEVLFLGGSGLRMPACPCRTVRVELLLKGDEPTSTFRLAGGEWFKARRVNWTLLQPPRGQQFLVPGQLAPIVLTSIPEAWERGPAKRLRQSPNFIRPGYALQ
jgi:hypothetical protein